MAAALACLASGVPRLGDWLADGVFYVLAGTTVAAAVATVTMRNPVYCALWFGLSLMGTAGLLLFTGAQFLAVATVVVYAGAILVTFLFVLMLAQPEGRAPYDRSAWEASVSAAAGIAMVGVLSLAVTTVLGRDDMAGQAALTHTAEAAGDRVEGVLAQQHVAAVGTELFGRQLIAIEVAGTLLLAALVGAAVIVAHSKGEAADAAAKDGERGEIT
jgi:NADH-quinone oxidoreductase subunit J